MVQTAHGMTKTYLSYRNQRIVWFPKGHRERDAVSNIGGLFFYRPTAEHIYFMLRVIRRGSPSAEAATLGTVNSFLRRLRCL